MSRKIEDIEAVVQIDDPELDVQKVMARIREGLVEHALEEGVDFPTFAIARARGQAMGSRGDESTTHFSEELYYQLEQANLNYDQVWVELALVETQMLLMGRLADRFKRELHRLVVYYVNMLGERQVTMNDAIVRVLNELVDTLESPVALARAGDSAVRRDDVADPVVGASGGLELQIGVLQRQVAELSARLERLEAQVGSGE